MRTSKRAALQANALLLARVAQLEAEHNAYILAATRDLGAQDSLITDLISAREFVHARLVEIEDQCDAWLALGDGSGILTLTRTEVYQLMMKANHTIGRMYHADTGNTKGEPACATDATADVLPGLGSEILTADRPYYLDRTAPTAEVPSLFDGRARDVPNES